MFEIGEKRRRSRLAPGGVVKTKTNVVRRLLGIPSADIQFRKNVVFSKDFNIWTLNDRYVVEIKKNTMITLLLYVYRAVCRWIYL